MPLSLEYQSLVPVLRRRLRRHNWHVLGLSAANLASALASWALLFFASNWLWLLVLSAVVGETARIPSGFGSGFAIVSAALLFIAWLDQRLFPDLRPPDHKSGLEIFGDFLLLVPRMTLAIPANLAAWQALSTAEVESAARLLVRVIRERKVPLQSAPVEIPNERTREKVIFALLILKVLEIRRDEAEAWLRLVGSERSWATAIDGREEREEPLLDR